MMVRSLVGLVPQVGDDLLTPRSPAKQGSGCGKIHRRTRVSK